MFSYCIISWYDFVYSTLGLLGQWWKVLYKWTNWCLLFVLSCNFTLKFKKVYQSSPGTKRLVQPLSGLLCFCSISSGANGHMCSFCHRWRCWESWVTPSAAWVPPSPCWLLSALSGALWRTMTSCTAFAGIPAKSRTTWRSWSVASFRSTDVKAKWVKFNRWKYEHWECDSRDRKGTDRQFFSMLCAKGWMRTEPSVTFSWLRSHWKTRDAALLALPVWCWGWMHVMHVTKDLCINVWC